MNLTCRAKMQGLYSCVWTLLIKHESGNSTAATLMEDKSCYFLMNLTVATVPSAASRRAT